MSAPEAPHPLLSTGYRRWMLAVLLLVSTVNYTDRFIFALLAEQLKRDLHFSDFQLGLIGGLAFALFYTLMGIPVARLAERWSRVKILSISVFIWSGMTALCGTANSFLQMLIYRVGVGSGEASFTPVTNSLVGDHFPHNRRASAISVIQLGSAISALLGAAIVSIVVAHWDWRVAFYVAGLPGILVALLVLFGLREPPRGLADGAPAATGAPPSLLAVLRLLLSKPTALHIILAGALAHVPFSAIGQFLSPFYIRVHEMSVRDAALLYGFMQAGAAMLGLLLSGFGSDRASDRDPRWHAWVPAISLSLAAPLYMAAFLQPTLLGAALFIFPASVLMFFYLVPTFAMIQNLVGPRMRASAVAIYGVISTLIGALGPALFGLISDMFARQSFAGDFAASCPGGRAPAGAAAALGEACSTAAANGLRISLACGMAIFLWAAFHYWRGSRTLARDAYRADA